MGGLGRPPRSSSTSPSAPSASGDTCGPARSRRTWSSTAGNPSPAFTSTLIAVDVATGWTECLPVWGQGYQRVGTAVHLIRQRLPFPLHELHTDNGGEFLNSILYPWCRREGIRFTRGRPYKKNDQAYAEQKVWAIVRRLVGYDRYSSRPAYAQLERLYELLRFYTNFFQPSSNLRSKERRGARLIKRFDAPHPLPAAPAGRRPR